MNAPLPRQHPLRAELVAAGGSYLRSAVRGEHSRYFGAFGAVYFLCWDCARLVPIDLTTELPAP